MLFTDCNDFFDKAARAARLSREEERSLALLMAEGDGSARQRVVESYLYAVSAFVRKTSGEYYSLELIYRLISALEREVDKFDFLQEHESFMHRLGGALRRELTAFIADK
jgi:DNA-directed RNA polymerase sigma subunit (sigma70/sigma32)